MNPKTQRVVISALGAVLVIVLGIFAMNFFLGMRKEPPKKPPSPRVRAVESGLVRVDTVAATIEAFGTLTSAQPVILYSEVQGILQKGDITFQPAARFKRGDLLFRIDDRQIRLDINSAKSDFLNALASVLPEIKIDFPEEYGIWERYFNNCSFDKKLEDLPETEQQKIRIFLSRFNVYKLFFTVRNLEIRLDKHFIYAPFNGSVLTADLRAGSTARNGSKLGEIINLDNMEVEVPVPASDLDWIDRSRPVLFSSTEIQGSWKGRIIRIGKTIDTRTQTVPVYMSISGSRDGLLYEGAFLKAHIPGKRIPDAVTIHRKALYKNRYAYVVDSGKLDMRELGIIRSETDSVIVNGGLRTGDTLVTEVLQGVAPGMPARAVLGSAGGGSTQ